MNEISGIRCSVEGCQEFAHQETVDVYGRPSCLAHRAPPAAVCLVFQPKTVTTDVGQYAAHAALCGCESDVFYLFQIVGQTHFHIQCAQCEQSYCPFGVCAIPPIQEEVIEDENPYQFQNTGHRR